MDIFTKQQIGKIMDLLNDHENNKLLQPHQCELELDEACLDVNCGGITACWHHNCNQLRC